MTAFATGVEARFARPFHLRFLRNLGKSLSWAWLDTVCRYRRSKIGPAWETINVLIMLLGITVVSSSVFGGGALTNMAYVGLGVIVWSAISSSVTEGATAFLTNGSYITGSTMSIDLYIGRTVFKVFITFCHHVVLYFIGLLFLPIPIGLVNLAALLGVFLLFVNAFWVTGVLAFLVARFRDLEMIVRNLMQLAFFVTPVFWNVQTIHSNRKFIVDYNILYYYLELVRAPLLGELPPLSHYAIVLGMTAFGYFLFYLIYRRLRRYLALFV
jgi:ABC-type polysaccharide/polyol phosphate export permease